MYSHSWSLVVTRGHSWSLVVTRGLLVVTRGHSGSFVVTRGHSWSLVCTFRHDHKIVAVVVHIFCGFPITGPITSGGLARLARLARFAGISARL